MATTKIVTWSLKDKNGLFSIGIKVSQNGISAYLFEGNAVASRDYWKPEKQEVKKRICITCADNFFGEETCGDQREILEFETDKKTYTAKMS